VRAHLAFLGQTGGTCGGWTSRDHGVFKRLVAAAASAAPRDSTGAPFLDAQASERLLLRCCAALGGLKGYDECREHLFWDVEQERLAGERRAAERAWRAAREEARRQAEARAHAQSRAEARRAAHATAVTLARRAADATAWRREKQRLDSEVERAEKERERVEKARAARAEAAEYARKAEAAAAWRAARQAEAAAEEARKRAEEAAAREARMARHTAAVVRAAEVVDWRRIRDVARETERARKGEEVTELLASSPRWHQPAHPSLPTLNVLARHRAEAAAAEAARRARAEKVRQEASKAVRVSDDPARLMRPTSASAARASATTAAKAEAAGRELGGSPSWRRSAGKTA